MNKKDYWNYSNPPPQYKECDAFLYNIECEQVQGKRQHCCLIPKEVMDDPTKYELIELCSYYPLTKLEIMAGKKHD